MLTTDVLIVGYGPVGEMLTILLAQRGLTVTAVERWATPYNFPRAVSYDGEASRVLAAAGVADRLGPVVESSGEYTFKNGFGRTLLHVKVTGDGPMGWPDSVSFYQPGLEALLAERGAELPGVTVLRPYQVTGLVEHDDRVEVTIAGPDGDEVRAARWVIGCDGANSFVREHLGSGVTDFGFTYDWLVCDVVPHEAREFKPNNLQVCDPARPRTAVSAGPGHRRWEFMRVPGESREEFESAASVWRLLGLFDITPDNATLERYGVYTTQACSAGRWRSGRILLAGDAAHVMPPFMGQGMSSGFRDALNLAWKLDLVHRGLADEALLDTYQEERCAHVQHAIRMSMDSGTVICETDRAAAAGRDAAMLAELRRRTARPRTRSLLEPLSGGILHSGCEAAGAPMPQGRVEVDGRAGLFDEVVGTGFVLLCAEDPDDLLDADARAFLDALGTRVVQIVPAGAPVPGSGAAPTAFDLDDVYLPHLKRYDAVAVLVRPDFYVFGTATDPAVVPALVEDLRRQIRRG
ncbi:bifunctional 3-(3-hydroxy-phenyl)propionate/3-hydroxycinnamic acid hydroxylase [Micromonospora aurantiaca (nom. illeg.)]|uniref:bifunctional 3-(3-hydroxy-phenyl)propionate/3-hydroxycinnamic acid hydroxylase MhpA n=1 Tax=Micromonospora aurantiaca (nom. illeg.) TaxID=47850 RepID=UPI003F49F802